MAALLLTGAPAARTLLLVANVFARPALPCTLHLALGEGRSLISDRRKITRVVAAAASVCDSPRRVMGGETETAGTQRRRATACNGGIDRTPGSPSAVRSCIYGI